MLIGRFGIMIPALALGGSLAAKNVVPESLGTFRTDNGMFVGLTIGVIVIIGGLTFFPAVALGPILEQLLHGNSSDERIQRERDTRERDIRLPIDGHYGEHGDGDGDGGQRPHGVAEARSLFDGEILRHALVDSIRKLNPRDQIKNPVMFVVLIGTIITFIEAIAHPGIFTWSITIWLLLTVLFANFAEAMAEGRGKAQADTLRKMRSETEARRLNPDGTETRVPAAELTKGDMVVCEAGDAIPRTARSSRAWPRSTSRPSPASRPLSSGSPAGTARL